MFEINFQRLSLLSQRFKIRMGEGFTLIEMSIVLVIIGFIIGGILVGQSLVNAAEARAQLSQIEKLNTAVNTFRNKFNSIPGDMSVANATQYGFTVGTNCNGTQGNRDGNNIVDGQGSPYVLDQGMGETVFFWIDLSSSLAGNLIEGQFPGNGAAMPICSTSAIVVSAATASNYFPTAKIGHSNFLYVYEVGGINWWGLSAIQSTAASGNMASNASIPVAQAYVMDAKADDGLPTTGNIQSNYITGSSTTIAAAPNTGTSGGNSTSCYDTTTNTYSISYKSGSGPNCALSFRFQ